MAKQFEDPTTKFFTRPNTETAEGEAPKTPGRPRKNPVKRNYHFNLNLDEDLKEYLQYMAWKHRTSITDYINTLARLDKEQYLRDCEEKGKDPFEGWVDK